MPRPKALIFPNEDALVVAMTSGMVPESVQSKAVRYFRNEDQEIGVCPTGRIAKGALAQLEAAGVTARAATESLEHADSWAELLAANRAPHEEGLQGGLVLFALSDERSLVDVAGELLRLGCDRQAYCFLGEGEGAQAFLRAADPPYYTVASAMEKTSGIKAYVPLRPGQELIFVELGYTHRMKEGILAPSGQVVLIPGEGPWRTIDNGPWTDVYQLIDFRLPEQKLEQKAIEPPGRLEVSLRMVRATRSEPASLWVVRDDAITHIDRLVRTLPNDVLDRLLFAVAEEEGEPIVILRARPSRSGPPEIDLPGEAYLPLLTIHNLYTPKNGMVEPPLRRDKLRELLAPESDQVAWLAPRPNEQFAPEFIPEAAFRPLPDWVDYILHSQAKALEPWMQGASFDFDLFVNAGAEWAEGPPPSAKKKPPKRPEPKSARGNIKRDHGRAIEQDELDIPALDDVAEDTSNVDALLKPIESTSLAPDQERLAALQKQFMELDAPLESPERRPLWVQMAQLNSRVKNSRDAALCWVSAIWESEGKDAGALAQAWAKSELGDLRKTSEVLTKTVAMSKPSREDVQRVVSALASSHLSGAPKAADLGDAHQLQVWLDRYDDPLDVRSLWLGRVALAEQVGGDRLAVARTRDRILTRLRNGLSLARDVPTFLRFIGGGGDEGAIVKLTDNLEQLLTLYQKTKRKPSPIEAPAKLTTAYVKFLFAYGFARLGKAERAKTLRKEAQADLRQDEKIHGFLSRAYSARIDHALEGLPTETPLPAEIAGELNQLNKLERYKVDRLRDHSKILETQERIDPFAGYYEGKKDPRGEEFEKLRGMSDEEAISTEIAKLMEVAKKAKPEERERLFEGIMDFFPLIPSKAVGHLETVVSHMLGIDPQKRAMMLEEALMLAGYFGREQLVKTLASELKGVLAQLGGEQMVLVASEFGSCLRGFKRVGLKTEAADLLEVISKGISGADVKALIARLHVAGAMLYLGEHDRANPTLVEAHERVEDAGLRPTETVPLTRALAAAWSYAPQDQAIRNLGRLPKQLKRMTDSFNTNSHFCLTILAFMEAIILGYASENLALGELGRRWLDEDEYLIRRKIHRATGAS